MSEAAENKNEERANFTFEMESDPRKRELTFKVVENIQRPLDRWAVAAILESMGLRDKDARQEFGTETIFRLAEEVYAICQRDGEIQNLLASQLKEKQKIENTIKSFVKYYSRGLSFMIPVLGQIALLFLFRYSLWAYIEFTEAQATVVALGTILSFIVSGGFVQAAGRDVLFYLNAGEYLLARMSYLRLFRYHGLIVIGLTIFFFASNILFPFFRTEMAINSLIYFVLLSELWFALTILYLAKHYFVVLFVTVVGILPVWAVMNFTDWGIFKAHFAGLLFANALSWLYALLWFRGKIRRQKIKNPARLPQRAIMAYVTSPYFVYGTLYFCFLFVDRLVSWSVFESGGPTTLIWFRTPYELGMDWALLSLFITIALLEFTIERFSATLIPTQDDLQIFDMDHFIHIYRRFQRRQFVALIVLGMGSIVATYFGVMYLRRFDYIREVRDFFSNRITFFAFYVAAISYLFMAIGLFNGLFFLTLSRLNFAVKAIAVGLLVNIFTGVLLSRWFGYEFGVFGLLAGSIVFAALSSRYSTEFFKKLDYFYYSAY
ncbi:MAG: hypothetical protein GXO74_11770 [Calditrichaeota bacterium]|nr:hypothetical protein [Calditrichota bacterium]